MAYKDMEKKREYEREYYQKDKERKATYGKKYREENPEKIAARHKRWGEKNKERVQAYRKECREKNREKLKKDSKEYYQKNKKKWQAYGGEHQRVCRQKVLDLFGNICFFCGACPKRLSFHEKFGKKHSSPSSYLVLKNPDDWALVCYGHHKGVHFCMKFLGMEWEEIEARFVKEYKNSSEALNDLLGVV